MDVGGIVALVALFVLVVFVISVVVRSVRVVPQASSVIVERLGRYSRTLEPGLHFLIPFVDRPEPRSTCASRWSPSRRSR